jgi:hypothetical protein
VTRGGVEYGAEVGGAALVSDGKTAALSIWSGSKDSCLWFIVLLFGEMGVGRSLD